MAKKKHDKVNIDNFLVASQVNYNFDKFAAPITRAVFPVVPYSPISFCTLRGREQ